jgi:hypothetical protein
MKFVC